MHYNSERALSAQTKLKDVVTLSRTVQRPGYTRSSRRRPPKRQLPGWTLVVIDLLLTGLCLLVFAYFHHVKPKRIEGAALPTPPAIVQSGAIETDVTPYPGIESEQITSSEEETAPLSTDSQPTEAPTEEISGAFGARFSDKFIKGDAQISENSYISENINISITRNEMDGAVYFIADIYIRDLEHLKTAFASDSFGSASASTPEIASSHNAILAISGDYAGFRDSGLVIRNGVQYRNKVEQDICVLYYDGTMETIGQLSVNTDSILAKYPYHTWAFGPMFLNDGQPMETFNCSVNPRNPRSAIGYFEPGHYCFVTVDGRQDGYSVGLTTQQMSQLFFNLGCKSAYNLDGGATAVMYFNGRTVNQPYQGGRSINDIVYIGE